jgi:alpha-amylase
LAKFQLVLIIHAHQPVGNFENVFEDSYRRCYLPFIETLEKHPRVRLALHFSGGLLDWIGRAHPEYFECLRELCARKQVEMLGGGFYEPILIAIPPQDRTAQLRRLADYIEKHFGARPRGAWLTERVWEPQLPSSLAQGGVEYTLVDDNHFLGGGFQPEQLWGYYTAEDLGRAVKLLPGNKTLRYYIPFRDAGETTNFLWQTAQAHPNGMAAMGDDLEKFGSWPGTHDHCYRNGWLENFFTALEACADWLDVCTPAEAIDSHAPMGRADLPTASYHEMMEWALPTPARITYHKLLEQFAERAEVLPFLRGGAWRGFFAKYGESNLMHKKMLRVSEKVAKLTFGGKRDGASAAAAATFEDARQHANTLLLSGQCNDAYWHGVFGGLYSPHLRSSVWRALVQAEAIADRLAHQPSHPSSRSLSHEGADYAEQVVCDFDADGRDEVYFTSNNYAVLVSPDDGGTVSAIDYRPSGAALVNSLARRPEAYHQAVKNSAGPHPLSLDSIDEQRRAKERGLDQWLKYDRWPRHCFRLLVFSGEKTFEEYASVQLGEDEGMAAGRYGIEHACDRRLAMKSSAGSEWMAEKSFSLSSFEDGFEISCDVRLQRKGPERFPVSVGLEMVVNLLAPTAPDRYFQIRESEQLPLNWSGKAATEHVQMFDWWQRVQVDLKAPGASAFWIAPIETVSESEDGFERIYQGSQIMAVWPVELGQGEEWSGRLSMRVKQPMPTDQVLEKREL